MTGGVPRTGARVLLAAGAPVAAALVIVGMAGPTPGRGLGLAAGVAAAVAAVVPAVYPLRRRLLARPLRTAAQWLTVHTAAGGAILPLVLVHEGARRPSGWLGWSMLAAAAWTTGWGWLALYRQRTLPARAAQANVPPAGFDAVADRLARVVAVHVPAAVLLIALIVFHLFAVWYF